MPVDQDALQRSVQDLLARVDSDQPGSRPVSDGLKAVIGAAEQILGADCVEILLLDEHEQLRPVASSDSIAADLEPDVDTVRTSTTVAIDDLRSADGYQEPAAQIDRLGVRAVVSAPVWVNGSVAGNLNAMRFGNHEWRADEIAAAETYADVVAAFLQVSVGRDRSRRGALS